MNALNNYKYDELGNLIADKCEEIANIEWTVNGKVKHITCTAGSTKPGLWFAYGADGQRISKTVAIRSTAVTANITFVMRKAMP